MSHRYQHPISVTCDQERPVRFTWQGADYTIAEVLATWRLRDRWWEAVTHSDRTYHRVQCAEGLLCELYVDAVHGKWVLDRVWD